MTLIKEQSNLIVLYERNKDLLEEHLIVLDGGAVEFQHGPGLAVVLEKRLTKRFEEFGFAQTLSSIQKNKRNCAGALERIRVELKLTLNFGLAYEVVKHMSNSINF
jgi:hypothetical protein